MLFRSPHSSSAPRSPADPPPRGQDPSPQVGGARNAVEILQVSALISSMRSPILVPRLRTRMLYSLDRRRNSKGSPIWRCPYHHHCFSLQPCNLRALPDHLPTPQQQGAYPRRHPLQPNLEAGCRGLDRSHLHSLGIDMDYMPPFAAFPEDGREIDGLDDGSELAHRVGQHSTPRGYSQGQESQPKLRHPSHSSDPSALSESHSVW